MREPKISDAAMQREQENESRNAASIPLDSFAQMNELPERHVWRFRWLASTPITHSDGTSARLAVNKPSARIFVLGFSSVDGFLSLCGNIP